MATTLPPDQPWPDHHAQHWRKALELAREAGWTLIYNGPDAHTWGWLHCPGGFHKFKVDKTARGSETVANEVIKVVRRCQHGPESVLPKWKQRVHFCEHRLTTVRQILAVATARVEAMEAVEAGWSAINELEQREVELSVLREQVELGIETVQVTIASIEDELAEIRAEHEAEADAVLAAASGPAEGSAVADALDEADALLDVVENEGRALRRSGRRAAATEIELRAASARRDAAGLRERLASLPGN